MEIISKIPDMDMSTEVARIEVYFIDGWPHGTSEWCVNYYNKSGTPINAIEDCVGTVPTYFHYKRDAIKFAEREMGYFETCKEIRVFARKDFTNVIQKIIYRDGSVEKAIDNNIEVA